MHVPVFELGFTAWGKFSVGNRTAHAINYYTVEKKRYTAMSRQAEVWHYGRDGGGKGRGGRGKDSLKAERTFNLSLYAYL